MSNENDVEKLKIEIERLKRLVYYDELTGLLNRRGFYEEVNNVFNALSFGQSEIERRIGSQIPFSIVFIDIDDFKKVNDIYGHEAGDAVLKIVGRAIQDHFRVGDVSARWGGEEFVISLPGVDSVAAHKIAEKLRQDLESIKIKIRNGELSVTISIGIAEYRDEKLVDLLEKADRAMYEAKSKGKNRIEIGGSRTQTIIKLRSSKMR